MGPQALLADKSLTRGEQLRMALESSASLSSALPSATLIKSSEGVQVIRNGKAFLAGGGHSLKLGDRLVVPDGGAAQAVFQEHDGQSMLGTFEGGSNASLVYFSRKNGACSVVFDVHHGQVEMSLSSQSESTDDSPPGRKVLGFHCYSRPVANR